MDTAPHKEAALPARYARWQAAIAAEFFGAAPGRPVVLFIDDAELARLAPAGAGCLRAAVAELVAVECGTAMFEPVLALQGRWQKGLQAEPPPTLPVLALSVLAATHMHRDAQAAPHNYYLRFAQALLPPGAPGAQVEAVRHACGEGGAFRDVADMWRVLDGWMAERGGNAGISTICDHPAHFTRIGYPLSQAIVRHSDHAALTQFFAAMDFPVLGIPGGGGLLEYLRIWASRPRGLSEAFLRTLGDPGLAGLLGPLLAGLAAHWDGRVVTADRALRLDVRVAIDTEEWVARWAIPTAEGIGEATLTGEVGGVPARAAVTRDPYSTLYRLQGMPQVTARALRDGFQLRGPGCAAEYAPSPVLLFSEDPDAEGWLSTRSVTPFEEHLLAAEPGSARLAEEVLRAAADPGWRPPAGRQGRPPLPGYVLFSRVAFSDPGRLAKALAALPGPAAAAIRPDLTARPRLANGLPLARQLAGNCYLAGGEPDLLLPAQQSPRPVRATLDGVSQEFHTSLFPVELARVFRADPLPHGPHTLVVGQETLRFTTVESLPGAALPVGTGELGWDSSGALVTGAGQAAVCGANAPDSGGDTEPVVIQRGQQEVWLVHCDGSCTPVSEPAAPKDLGARVPGLLPYCFEITPPATAVWLARRHHGDWVVCRVGDAEPCFGPLDRQSLTVWAQIADAGPDEYPLWKAYLRSWEQLPWTQT